MQNNLIKISLTSFALIIVNLVYGQEIVDSIAVIVDEEIILESEIAQGIQYVLLEQGPRARTIEQIEEIRNLVVNQFIAQKVLLARAQEETIAVEPRRVDRELDRRMELLINQAGGEDKLVAYFEKPLRQIRREFRKRVEEEMIMETYRHKFIQNVKVRRRDVEEFYNEHREEIPELPERIELSHILLEITPSDDAMDMAYQRILEVYEIAQSGADFDSLAKDYSEDASAEFGGKLGMTTRGDLVPEYEEAAYQLDPGEISEPVLSRYGLHVIKLLERQGERISTQHILIKLNPTPDDSERIHKLADELRSRAIAGDDFAELAKQYSDDEESANRGGKLEELPVEQLPEALRLAVVGLQVNDISEPVETEFGIHLLRVDQRHPARMIDLKTDWQMLEQYALISKQEQAFEEWINKIKREHYIYPQ